MTTDAKIRTAPPSTVVMRRLKRDAAPAVADAVQVKPAPDGEIHAFLLDTPRPDEYGNRILSWDLSDFNRGADGTGPVLFMHRDGSFWSGEGFPIGRAVARMEGVNLVMSVVRYDEKDERAMDVKRRVDDGFLDCASARFTFDYDEARPNELGGYDIPRARLLEGSIVVLPGHSDAVRIRGAGGDDVSKARATLEARLGPGEWVPRAAARAIAAACAGMESKTEEARPPEPALQEARKFTPTELAEALARTLTTKEP